MDLTIEILAGVMDSCTLANGDPCSDADPDPAADSRDIEVSFAEIPKNLTITVTLASVGDPVAIDSPAFITITDSTTLKVRSALTDSEGRLDIDVPAGTYDIRATWVIDGVTVTEVSSATLVNSLPDGGTAVALVLPDPT